MVDCAKGRCAVRHSRSALAGLQFQPGRGRLEQRHIAFPPLAPGQQLGCLDRRHAQGCADRSRRGDAAVVQLPAAPLSNRPSGMFYENSAERPATSAGRISDSL